MRALSLYIALTLVAATSTSCGNSDNSGTPGGAGGTTVNADASGTGGGADAGGGGTGGSGGASGTAGTDAAAGASGTGGTDAGRNVIDSGADVPTDAEAGTPSNDSSAEAEAGAADAPEGSPDADGSTGSGACTDASTDKLIFISSALYTGNLGGLSGADSKCHALAQSAGLCGTFKAWLSDATATAADRLTHATGDYVLTNGQIVAHGWSGLTAGTLQHAIDRTETNGAAPVGTVTCGGSAITPVWTGSTSAGTTFDNGSCANWSGGSSGAIFGNALSTNFAWSGMCQLTTVCVSTAALYCVEQ